MVHDHLWAVGAGGVQQALHPVPQCATQRYYPGQYRSSRLARHHHDATCCLTGRGASNDSKGNESGTDKDKYRSEGLDGGIKATSHSQAQEASTGTQAVGSV